MDVLQLKSIIAAISCLLTLSFFFNLFNNKSLSLKNCWYEEFSLNYVTTVIYSIIFLFLFLLSFKLVMPKYDLDFNLCLYWLISICFLKGFDKSTERLIITSEGISLKTSLLGINNNTFISWNYVCGYKLYLGNSPLLKILYTIDDLDDDYNFTNELSFYILKKDIDKLEKTLKLFITTAL